MGESTWDKAAAERAAEAAAKHLHEAAEDEAQQGRDLTAKQFVDWWAMWVPAAGHRALHKVACKEFSVERPTRFHKQEEFA